MLKSDITALLEQRHAELLSFWLTGKDMPEASVEAHCDMIYTLYMLGDIDRVSADAVDQFLVYLRAKNLPGWKPEGTDAPILVHNCAYAFGALNLLSASPAPLYDAVLAGREPDLDAIVDAQTNHPKFPPKWAHHNWRVSHWIGGIPSLILSVARSGSKASAQYAKIIEAVRPATDDLLDHRTGLIKAYRSEIVQQLFRRLYAVRHDPELGDVGGVAHILWVDHAMGRRYLALDSVLKQSQELFHRNSPFMEKVPYCLDFDIVQIVRTGLDQTGEDRSADTARANKMMADIENFFSAEVPSEYSLHKIPGALATYHECALIGGVDPSASVGRSATDIISRAYWL